MQQYRYEIPVQGYIVDRKKRGHEWIALVTCMEQVDDDQVLVQRWVPMRRLRPVFSRPEDGHEQPY